MLLKILTVARLHSRVLRGSARMMREDQGPPSGPRSSRPGSTAAYLGKSLFPLMNFSQCLTCHSAIIIPPTIPSKGAAYCMECSTRRPTVSRARRYALSRLLT
ncbi:hypothetical protein DPMN_116383 [Dreissena polymorpha]|uniref:Uncharacterized protein n=1 Tax=Dreissena polymorpha TaxID=45954 RepID=A0A9D4QTH9_DREPO|nr:hypothetical protein DPMN_116383 [Dreissena polymorpha]